MNGAGVGALAALQMGLRRLSADEWGQVLDVIHGIGARPSIAEGFREAPGLVDLAVKRSQRALEYADVRARTFAAADEDLRRLFPGADSRLVTTRKALADAAANACSCLIVADYVPSSVIEAMLFPFHRVLPVDQVLAGAMSAAKEVEQLPARRASLIAEEDPRPRLKGLRYRFRAARNAASSTYGPCEDWVDAMLAILPELTPELWDRFALFAREFERADLVTPWRATLARAESLAEQHARGVWWNNAFEAAARLTTRPILESTARLNRRATELNMTIGLSSALEAATDLGQVVASTASTLTVRDLQSEADRQLIWLPMSRAIPSSQLEQVSAQARVIRARATGADQSGT